MNPRQLEVFMVVMRTGSLSVAARELGVSQPAISKSLRLAEQAAGFVLFRRVRGQLFPSPEAETLLPQVERLSSDLDAISLLMRQLREGGAGSVTVAAPGSIAHPFLTPAVARFSREHPNIRVEVMILTTSSVAEHVARSQADFGVIHQPTDNPYVSGDVICEGEGVCVLPKRHPLAERKSLSVRDLQKERIICYRDDTAIGSLVREALSATGGRREVDIVINQSQQALDFVEAGAGLAVMDPFLLVASPRASLTAIPFRPSFPNRLRIIRPRERPRSRAAARLEAIVHDMMMRRLSKSPLAILVRPV
ncbi:MAG: LysR family transcriptional regulator [Lautropia sp.]